MPTTKHLDAIAFFRNEANTYRDRAKGAYTDVMHNAMNEVAGYYDLAIETLVNRAPTPTTHHMDCPDCGLGYDDIHDKRCSRYKPESWLYRNERLNDSDRALLLQLANVLESLTYSMDGRERLRLEALPLIVDVTGIALVQKPTESRTYQWLTPSYEPSP